MDKIDIHFFLNDMNTKQRTIVLLDVVNELVEGYNKTMKRLKELEDEFKERYYDTSG